MLSNDQKRYLSQLATRAFNRACALARGRGEDFAAPFQSKADEHNNAPGRTGRKVTAEEMWRHDEVAKACGKLGLRCCSQSDYKAVEGHFLGLLGDTGRAFKAIVQSHTEGRRQWEYKVDRMAKALDKNLAYVNAISLRVNKGTGLEDASEDQLRKVFFALKYQFQREKQRNDFQEV